MNSEALRSESDEPHHASADSLAPPKAFASPDSKWELIQLFVRVTQVLGIPRSVGEIFGFIFTSPSPVAFDEIVDALGVSNGSASHGLRYLRRVGAIQLSYHARDRRDFYSAETSLRKMAGGFLAEKILLQLRGVDERLLALQAQALQNGNGEREALVEQIGLLQSWSAQASSAISAALQTLR